ncbi:TetR/AcrR family transcriptional regulator [Streptomyces sp. TRM 70361]|uniref:TetR/AcrR family transcriptional regulator n=1 Tax=Streptomyces sp. TRM 70361 TaxID=3116553 RepID=UPI002E7AF2BE|nr:TetR/AcrR family transcriptional regulator [Streptomyces sp. TRM 70361]MEE1939928.1 TetR/AcrR family transcriptional regulator [Streptomyces sp. TRM 70361]
MTTGVRRRMGVEERRQQLLDVALRLFSDRSPENVSIDDIATAAGISRPLVYHYFPGKYSLYEAAVRRAADELSARFSVPHEGPFSSRLLLVMDRYFDFVEQHAPGFSALLRGGSAAGSMRADAVIDEVRQAAYEQLLAHLEVSEPGPRMALVIRSWVGVAETTALSWLEERSIPRGELELRLVHELLALAAVTAAFDEETARVFRRVAGQEPADGPFGELVERLSALTAGAFGAPGTPAGAGPASSGGTPDSDVGGSR